MAFLIFGSAGSQPTAGAMFFPHSSGVTDVSCLSVPKHPCKRLPPNHCAQPCAPHLANIHQSTLETGCSNTRHRALNVREARTPMVCLGKNFGNQFCLFKPFERIKNCWTCSTNSWFRYISFHAHAMISHTLMYWSFDILRHVFECVHICHICVLCLYMFIQSL